MAKKPSISKATTTESEPVTSQQDTAPLLPAAVSGPSGDEGPDGINTGEDAAAASTDAAVDRTADSTPAKPEATASAEGTDTPASDSGAVAGEASADPVKPQEDASQTGAMVAEAVTGTPTPEAETAASGMSSYASQAEVAGDVGANAGVSAGLSAGGANAILSKVLGVTIAERRKFIVWKQVRHDNVLYERGSFITVDGKGHAVLAEAKKVSPRWDAGEVVG